MFLQNHVLPVYSFEAWIWSWIFENCAVFIFSCQNSCVRGKRSQIRSTAGVVRMKKGNNCLQLEENLPKKSACRKLLLFSFFTSNVSHARRVSSFFAGRIIKAKKLSFNLFTFCFWTEGQETFFHQFSKRLLNSRSQNLLFFQRFLSFTVVSKSLTIIIWEVPSAHAKVISKQGLMKKAR